MNCLLVTLLLCLAGLSIAAKRRTQEATRRDGNRSNRLESAISSLHMFPSCRVMNQAIKDKYTEMCKSNQVGPGANNCHENDRMECLRKDMDTVRCAVTMEPSDKCIHDVIQYLHSSPCDEHCPATFIYMT